MNSGIARTHEEVGAAGHELRSGRTRSGTFIPLVRLGVVSGGVTEVGPSTDIGLCDRRMGTATHR